MHVGHLLLAEAALTQAGLDKALFMPAHIQPFKQDVQTLPDDDRIRMLRLAIADNPRFGVTTVEADTGGVSYTIDSLRALRDGFAARNSQAGTQTGAPRLCFIIGTDMFLNIEKWKDSDSLVREFDFAVGVRPGYRHDEAVLMAQRLRESSGTRVDLIDNPPIELSSTEIRSRVLNGDSIRYRVPESVRRYLLVLKQEGETRFAHTKRVIDLASEMAARFGEDAEKTALAALLHDYCKDPDGGVENDINHGSMAAEAARTEFGVTDEDVLNAIRYHTTGRAGMSKLERIIFLADTVEPGRTYESITRLRENCLNDLDMGILNVLIELKKYLLKKGLTVSGDTEAAIMDLTKGCRTN